MVQFPSMGSGCLFTHDEKCIGADDFTKALKAVGAQDNDTLFIHSDITRFGKIGPDQNRESLCKNLIHAIEASTPGGTVAMPAFTYSFCKGTPYDVQHSPSEVGTLSEFFRTEEDVTRSLHPIFSVAAKGPGVKKLFDIDMDSFGDNSFFSNLLKVNGLVVSIGTILDHFAFVHHIEQMHSVPYRFVKTFKGVVRDGEKEIATSCTYFVRHLDQDVELETSRLESRLHEEGLLKTIAVGAGKIFAVRAQDLFSTGMSMLDEDIYSLSTLYKKKD